MRKRQSEARSRQEVILERNKNINRKVVIAHNRLERQLNRLGVEIRSDFRLEPPLGRNRSRLNLRNH